MWSHDVVSANRRPTGGQAEREFEAVWARCRRQEVVIHTLGELVATLKAGARSLEAENLLLSAENDRLRGSRAERERYA
jgi:hypothetical protein